MKIILFEVSKEEQTAFSQLFKGHEVSYIEEKLEEKNVDIAKDADVICVFITSIINKKIIDALPAMKFIAIRATGYNTIDCEYAQSHGVKISNVPAYGSHTVAEFAFGLILNLSRNIIMANNYIREKLDFNYFPKMEGFDIVGKTLGIIGTGKIGKNVLKIAQGFGMNVVAYDLYPDLVFAKENNFEYKSLNEVISASDIITLHTPYTKENHHLINKENISLMKKGVYLINTARGELVDTTELVLGLKGGVIAGFGADVLEGEEQLKDEKNLSSKSSLTPDEKKILDLNHELIKMQNVIITPHIAFYSHEAVASIQKTTVENIESFISNSPINLVK